MKRKFKYLVNGRFHLVEVLIEKKTAISDCRCVRFYAKDTKDLFSLSYSKVYKTIRNEPVSASL